ncbi:MAG TPA: crossover junction endodeoxyribonuclease RuvC, partial [Chloroflexi bacterium]|nr:crossover junction endodeoxyribonuclease RuvC [Chloroflexota bacterium]
MITLGVDPGTALLGYGLVRGETEPSLITYGVVSTTSSEMMEQRLLQVYDAVRKLIEEYEPDELAIEQL